MCVCRLITIPQCTVYDTAAGRRREFERMALIDPPVVAVAYQITGLYLPVPLSILVFVPSALPLAVIIKEIKIVAEVVIPVMPRPRGTSFRISGNIVICAVCSPVIVIVYDPVIEQIDRRS